MEAAVNAYRAEPYDYTEARALADALELSEPVAIALVRRGYRTPEAARAFLEADESHSPDEFRSMGNVTQLVLGAIEAGRRITVHGDFDVDGVCATTILVGTLRQLGADCDWLIPDRMADGYGLSRSNVERLAGRGTRLLITVDCGITAVEEVALARSLGIEAIVTDHHQPGARLPDCPILHPALDGYPFPDLCGTAVAWKLASALREGLGAPPTEAHGTTLEPKSTISCATASGGGAANPYPADSDLDLVALATVADLVPLVGENRSLVRRGLEEIRRARRPGMRALLEAARCEPDRLDEGDLAFRLAPRVNAAGRLYRADAGVELFLTAEAARAAEIAAELSRANGERRVAEREVEAAAEAARRELPERLREAPGLVLAGRGWHRGVVGLVASRLAERHHRPVVVVSLDEQGGGRGSGRSIPGFDLLAGLEACSEHLAGFGGHRAAAGLELRAASLDAFREAFAAHAAAVLGPEELTRTERIDAMVGGAGLGLDLAEELGRLAPFGMGNPGVRLLVPSARVRDVRTMGEGKHSRFSLHSGAHRALGVAFGRARLGVGKDEPVDAAVRLEVNRWNGAVEPRVVLRELYPLEPASDGDPPHVCACPQGEWWERFEAELDGSLDPERPQDANRTADVSREAVDGSGSTASVLAELLSSGAGVLAVCADASRRAALAGGAGGLDRFNGAPAAIACSRCARAAVGALAGRVDGGLALTDYAALEAAPGLAAAFDHVVLVDPPTSPRHERLATLPAGGPGTAHPGWAHPVWSEAEIPFAASVLGEQLARRPCLSAMFRDLRKGSEAGEAEGERLLAALRGTGRRPRGPEAAARCFRVLAELGLVRGRPEGGGGTIGVVSSEGTDLERSAAFRAYGARHEEGRRYLERRRHP